MHVLECRGLERRFGETRAVAGVSFTVAEGETYGLLGPNGAGKTTTISMVVGLLAADAGTVLVGGQPMDPTSRGTKRLVGYVPQEIAVYPDLTARENLAFFAKLHELEARNERIEHVLDVVALAGRADERVDTYSGGMQRRLNIAIGLLHDPRLLVLDEPTVGVDPQSRDAIMASITRLSSAGTAVLYTTHYMEEAERLCDRIGIIDDGRIVAEGTRRELVGSVGERDRVSLTVAGDIDAVVRRLRSSGVADEIGIDADGTVLLLVEGAAGRLPAIINAATAMDGAVTGVQVKEPDLESVFLHLTGRALRDG